MNKRITVIAWRDLWHPEMGGAEIYLTKMLEGLAAHGFDVTVLTSMYEGAREKETKNGVTYIRKGGRYSIYFELPLYYLSELKSKTDLIIESYNAMPFWTPIFEKRLQVIIYHIQSVEWIRNFGAFVGGLIYSFLNLFFPFVYRGSDIITISPSTRDEIQEMKFMPSSISVVSTGIDMPLAESVDKPTGTVNVISLGRLKMTKNVDKAIGLIEYAVKTMQDVPVRMKIAGKGEEEENLKKLVKEKGLGKYVEFLGYVSEDEKVELYRWGHIHLQLSEKEGWGITAIEAASQGTPTMCMDVPGLRDSVKDETGYIVVHEEDLREEWQRVVREIQKGADGYKERQKACLAWAKEFEWDRQVKKFRKVVERRLKEVSA